MNEDICDDCGTEYGGDECPMCENERDEYAHMNWSDEE